MSLSWAPPADIPALPVRQKSRVWRNFPSLCLEHDRVQFQPCGAASGTQMPLSKQNQHLLSTYYVPGTVLKHLPLLNVEFHICDQFFCRTHCRMVLDKLHSWASTDHLRGLCKESGECPSVSHQVSWFPGSPNVITHTCLFHGSLCSAYHVAVSKMGGLQTTELNLHSLTSYTIQLPV